MSVFIERHTTLLKALLKHKVDFMLIGGYAVMYHGYKRTTAGINIWLKPDTKNREKLISTFKDMEFTDESLEDLSKLDFAGYTVFCIWEEPERADFTTIISHVEYEDADPLKIMAEIDGMKVPIIDVDDLILSKYNTGRAQDNADVEELKRINSIEIF